MGNENTPGATAGQGGAPATTSTGAPGNQGGGASPSGGTPPAWYSAFPDETRGYVEAKGFKDPLAVVESYRNAEKLLGVPKERLVRLPDKDDAPEWGEVYSRLGRPEKADGYEVPVPKGGTDDFAKWAQGLFHEQGLSKKQGETLATKWNERVEAVTRAQEEKSNLDSHAQVDKLRTEWGSAYEQNVQTVNKFCQAAGIPQEAYMKLEGALGIDNFNKLVHGIVQKFGIQLGEGEFHGGGGPGNGFGNILSPAAAKAKIDMLSNDKEWTSRYLNGGAKEKEEMERLHRWMAS